MMRVGDLDKSMASHRYVPRRHGNASPAHDGPRAPPHSPRLPAHPAPGHAARGGSGQVHRVVPRRHGHAGGVCGAGRQCVAWLATQWVMWWGRWGWKLGLEVVVLLGTWGQDSCAPLQSAAAGALATRHRLTCCLARPKRDRPAPTPRRSLRHAPPPEAPLPQSHTPWPPHSTNPAAAAQAGQPRVQVHPGLHGLRPRGGGGRSGRQISGDLGRAAPRSPQKARDFWARRPCEPCAPCSLCSPPPFAPPGPGTTLRPS